MSQRILDNQTLQRIYDEILDDMKRQGTYDNIRMRLVQPIFDDPNFQDIVKEYTRECERFCETADLSKQRNELRISLAARIEANSRTGRAITNHIKDLLDKHKLELREEFRQHAKAYVRRYKEDEEEEQKAIEGEKLNEISEANATDEDKAKSDQTTPEVKSDDGEKDMDIDSPPITSPIQRSPTPPPMSPITSLIKTSPISSLESDKASSNIVSKDMQNGDFDLDDISIPEAPPYSPIRPNDMDQEETTIRSNHNHLDTQQNNNHREEEVVSDPSPSPAIISNDNNDELEELIFSEVSSVNTCDLSDFEGEINLTDDEEADLVGKPKNSKVGVKDLQSITDCPPTNPNEAPNESKAEPTKPSEPSAPVSHDTREVSNRRTRKSNPRYSNPDYLTKLL